MVADALEENFEQHEKVLRRSTKTSTEDSAMEESSQDEGEDCNKMEVGRGGRQPPAGLGDLVQTPEELPQGEGDGGGGRGREGGGGQGDGGQGPVGRDCPQRQVRSRPGPSYCYQVSWEVPKNVCRFYM